MIKRVLAGWVVVALLFGVAISATGVEAQDADWVHVPVVSKLPGEVMTGVGIQNTDQAQPAIIEALFYPQASVDPPIKNLTQAKPSSAEFLYLPTSPLPDGVFAMRAQADRRIAAIVRDDWPVTGSATIYSQAIPDAHIIVPLATKRYGNQCSSVSVQNTDPAASTEAIAEFYAIGDSTPTHSKEVDIGGGTSVTLRLCEDADLDGQIPDGFLGSMQVKSKDGVTGLAVQSSIELQPQNQATYAFEGIPASYADSVLYAPLFRASQPLGDRRVGVTGIAVTNILDDDVEVTVSFRPAFKARDACGRTPFHQQMNVPGHSNVVFWQGQGGSPVPAGCFGSATITASDGGKILAVVVDSVDDQASGQFNITSAAYNAFSGAQGGLVHALPLFRTGHTQHSLWTGISIMNVGSQRADVVLSVTNTPTGETIPDSMSASIAPYETLIYWPGATIESPGEWDPPWGDPNLAYGSAMVRSNQPVVVIVNDSAQTRDPALQIDAATYAGIPLD